MRLIDADVTYKVLADYYHHRTETQHEALKEALSKVPTIDAKQVRYGRWLKNGDRYCECSVCHHEGNISGQDNYCWYCGAKMSKAIATFEMPKDCSDCPCEYDYLHCKLYECITNKRSPSPDYDERPKWCPLKEAPSYQDELTDYEYSIESYRIGWNDCLKEILGDKDE